MCKIPVLSLQIHNTRPIFKDKFEIPINTDFFETIFFMYKKPFSLLTVLYRWAFPFCNFLISSYSLFFSTKRTSFSICFYDLFLIGGKLFHSIVLVSAIHQHESAISIHMSRLARWLSGKEPACKAGATGDVGSIPGSWRGQKKLAGYSP